MNLSKLFTRVKRRNLTPIERAPLASPGPILRKLQMGLLRLLMFIYTGIDTKFRLSIINGT